jgi:hypothetical protein
MPEKRNISRDAETDRCIQRANGLLILAERELSAFMSAVDKCFGAEQARQSALDWIAVTFPISGSDSGLILLANSIEDCN